MAKQGNKKRDPNKCTEAQFEKAIGRAVVAWQHVEVSVSTLFRVLLKAENEMGARAAIYRIGNFSMRIELLEVAARWVWATYEVQASLPNEWDGLRERLYRASDLRNRLAHSQMMELGEGRSRTFILQPPMFDFSRVDPKNLRKHVETRLKREVDYKTADAAVTLFEMLCHDIYKLRVQVEKLSVRKNKLAG